jgi:hypothetical protein
MAETRRAAAGRVNWECWPDENTLSQIRVKGKKNPPNALNLWNLL